MIQNPYPATEQARPPLGSLGDCLQETASHAPAGYTRILGCTESFWRDIPADKPGESWLVLEAVTAALDLAPVTIHIAAGTDPAIAREILKKAARWLKEYGNDLPSMTPIEPPPCATSDQPF